MPGVARDARLTIVATGYAVALNCAAGKLAPRPRSGAGQIEAGMGAAAKLWSGRGGGDRFGLPWGDNLGGWLLAVSSWLLAGGILGFGCGGGRIARGVWGKGGLV